MKQHLANRTQATNNTMTLKYLLTFWEQNGPCTSNTGEMSTTRADSYVTCSRTQVDQPVIITTSDALQNLVDQVQKHRHFCRADLHLDLASSSGPFSVGIQSVTGHKASLIWQCLADHEVCWDSSPYLPNG